jgi:MOSC domain-containing protein YiiM
MPQIGTITLLQVQIASLKVGEERRQRYDPAPLRRVPAIEVDPDGAVGLAADGERLLDVHNRRHPASKQRQGVNGLSFGFTSHYDEMRARFGATASDGAAGENILVTSDRRWTEDELAAGLLIETGSGQRLPLVRIKVAAPCVEFTRWVMRFPDDARPDLTVTENVQFLDHGLRGYYTAYDGPPATITVGDRVFLAD